MSVNFPNIVKLELIGFDKIFMSNNVIVDFCKPVNIILGGNGLGKTTILQSIIFALTGGTDHPDIEENKKNRWNHDYFFGRIGRTKIDEALVLIEFSLGNISIKLKRNISNGRIIELICDETEIPTTDYNDLVVNYGNFENFQNFAFLVNRLIYLSEDRRSLLWDPIAQVRVLMIMSNDVVTETEYRELRENIKYLDSTKRHTTVFINKANKLLQQKSEPNTETKNEPEELEALLQRRIELNSILITKNDHRKTLKSDFEGIENSIGNIAEEIKKINEQIQIVDSTIIENFFEEFDNKHLLINDKAIKYGSCPYCGENSKEFQVLAKDRLHQGLCIVCGYKTSKEHEAYSNSEIENLRNELTDLQNERDSLLIKKFQAGNLLNELDEEISSIRSDIQVLDKEQVTSQEEEIGQDEDISLEDLEKAISTRAELESEIMQKTQQADNLFDEFIDNFESRFIKLSEIFKSLSTQFLGKDVSIVYESYKDRLADFKFLIPEFDDEIRKSQDDCSEAQRFFLDIAFRMSLIQLNLELSGNCGTFINETPESALDISYIGNVVNMFDKFIESKNKIIITSNIQKMGLAYELVSTEGDNASIFDLLEHGRLSDVQANCEELFSLRDEIIGAANG